MKVIFGVCAWGLGHATRSLPIIRKLIAENNDVTVICSGRALAMLKAELVDSATYIDIPDYPAPKKSDKVGVLVEGLAYIPLYINCIRREMRAFEKVLARDNYGLIVADNRYGIYSKRIPSFIITHQLRIMNPFRLKVLERGTETYNRFFLKDGRRSGIIVPDWKDDSLSGDLSHNLHRIDESDIDYIGPISDFAQRNVEKDIDVFFSVSGPEPHRSALEMKIRSQLDSVDGSILFSLGKSESRETITNGNVTICDSLSSKDRELALNRAKLVVSRSGYSTLMDIASVGTKALFIPTPNQPEQEYLGAYHRQKGTYHCVSQEELDLNSDIKKAHQFSGLNRKVDTKKAVENAMRVFFSGKTLHW